MPRPGRVEDVRLVPMDEDGKYHCANESKRNQDAAGFHEVSFTSGMQLVRQLPRHGISPGTAHRFIFFPPHRNEGFGRICYKATDATPDKLMARMRAASISRFQTTSWSLVLAAAGQPSTQAHTALAKLCQTYWLPVYSFIRRSGYEPDQAQDLAQSFFMVLLEKNYLGDADQHRGRFRSFLMTSVKHFLANERDCARALKRGGGRALVSIEAMEAEGWYAPAAVEFTTPESLFERRWALSLLEQAMARLRAEFGINKARQFEKMSVFLNCDPEGGRYDGLAAELEMSAGALRVAVHRMRQKYRNLLRAEIAETVSTPEEVDEEIRFLLSALSG
jgi:DNA-directed RNA polymerase specialized sigma24 family protein